MAATLQPSRQGDRLHRQGRRERCAKDFGDQRVGLVIRTDWSTASLKLRTGLSDTADPDLNRHCDFRLTLAPATPAASPSP